jgi:glycosyltransferase involved in cell wall biosynthesis
MPVMDFGGVESRIITQASLMDVDKFDFRICTFWKKGAAAAAVEALGVRVDELGTDPSPKNPRALLRLAEYVFENRVDVVHASILEANLQAAMLRRIPGAPSVAIEEVGMPIRSIRSRLAFGAVYRQADVVVGVSEKTCEGVRRQHWLPAEKVRLIYNAINPKFLAPIQTPPPRQRPRLLAVGRLVEVKNQEVLLRALARMTPAERPELYLAGEGSLRGHFERLIVELGLNDSVRLLGFRDDVKALLDDADAYVMPSFSEGTSISLAEAMARARPVLTSRADGIDEAMSGYPPGWQLDPRDTAAWVDGLRRLAALPTAARAHLGQSARELVLRRMSTTAWKRDLESLYVELAEKTRLRRMSAPGQFARRLTQRAFGRAR